MATTNLGADLFNNAETARRAGLVLMAGEYLAGTAELIDLADDVNMSPRQLRRKFNEVDGGYRDRGTASIIVRKRKGL
jgi:transcriptional regulator GlxA family with amidase domain